jgi:SAM-dependent methyltransferase
MDKSLLTKIIGFPATLIHGDTLVLDRWQWLKARLPVTKNGENLIDIGCGTGAFSIGASLRGYESLGLSWDERNQEIAGDRAKICKATSAQFDILDVRNLDTRNDLIGKFDVAICFENIEHIIDDGKLMRDIASCLKPGGRLLLTTPYLLYRPIAAEDSGPFSKTEDGWHVRRGYSKAMLEELCQDADLVPEQISYCSGIISQKVTTILRSFSKIHPLVGWVIILPLRLLPPAFDRLLTNLIQWPYFSICLEAYKPRLSQNGTQEAAAPDC